MPRPKGSKNKSKADVLHEAYVNTPHPRKGWPKGKKRGPRNDKSDPKMTPIIDQLNSILEGHLMRLVEINGAVYCIKFGQTPSLERL